MKTCIYGAGAIGGWIGAALAQADERINVVARGATLAALQQNGLTIVRPDTNGENGDESRVRVPVHAVGQPAELGPQDLVVIAVKAPALAAVAERIGPLIGPDTIVLTAMNGVPWWILEGGFGGPIAGRRLASVDPGGAIAAAIPARHVIGGVVHASCSLDAPGVVRRHFGNGLIVGEPSGEASERVQRLAALLTRGGIDARVSPQIQKDVWYKLWGNMTMNPISLLTGSTVDAVLADPLVLEFIDSVMVEAKQIAARLGIVIDQQPADRHRITATLGAFKTSMLQDVEAGRAVELDALLAAVVELAELTEVPAANTRALFGLSRLRARELGLYPR